MALWNYAPPGQTGAEKKITVRFEHTDAKKVSLWRVDADHGDFHRAYAQMGSPASPTQVQVQKLRQTVQSAAAAESLEVKNSELTVEIPSSGLVLLELK